jgi:hypothetical protein
LGVRSRPSIEDWASIISGLAAETKGAFLPFNERGTAISAVHHVAKLLSEQDLNISSDCKASFLIPVGHKPDFVPARKAIWLDRTALNHRCAGLRECGFHFIPADLISLCDNPSQLPLLCQHFGIGRASSLLSEELSCGLSGCDVAVASAEERLVVEALLGSQFFIDGLYAVAQLRSPSAQAQHAELNEVMQGLTLRWVQQLRTVLVLDMPGGVRKELANSSAEVPCFSPQGELILCSHSLATNSPAFLRGVAEQINAIFIRQGFLQMDGLQILAMLSCRHPAEIPAALQKAGVDVGAEHMQARRVAAGAAVEDCFLADVQYALEDTTFSVGETVAVRAEDGEGGPAPFRYAIVLPLLEEDHVATSFMRRQYRLQVGPSAEDTQMVKLVDVFKLTCVPSAPSGPIPEIEDFSTAEGSALPPKLDGEASMHVLVSRLREMESLELDEYKSAFRRLCLQYHPDKSGVESGPLFNLIMRHCECFKSWMEKGVAYNEGDWCSAVTANVTPKADGDSDGDIDPGCDAARRSRHASFSTWVHEVTKEHMHVQSCIHSHHRPRAYVFVDLQSCPGAARRRDEEESARWFQQALADQRVAVYVAAGGFHAHAVWVCQQAAEKLMKVRVASE